MWFLLKGVRWKGVQSQNQDGIQSQSRFGYLKQSLTQGWWIHRERRSEGLGLSFKSTAKSVTLTFSIGSKTASPVANTNSASSITTPNTPSLHHNHNHSLSLFPQLPLHLLPPPHPPNPPNYPKPRTRRTTTTLISLWVVVVKWWGCFHRKLPFFSRLPPSEGLKVSPTHLN